MQKSTVELFWTLFEFSVTYELKMLTVFRVLTLVRREIDFYKKKSGLSALRDLHDTAACPGHYGK